MRSTVYKVSQQFITIIYFFLMGLTLYFALTSANLVIGDNPVFGQSTTMVSAIFVMLVGSVIILIVTFDNVRLFLHNIFVVHKQVTAGILLAIVVLGQVIFVYFVHPATGFDSGMVHLAATSTKSLANPETKAYFSLNQNNLPILLFEHWLTVVFGLKSWLFFDYLTLFFVDISALFNILTIACFDKKKVGAALYIHVFYLALFPSIIMTYTDTWVLPLVSFYLFCYAVLCKQTRAIYWRLLASLGFAMGVVLTYFMKPSAIVPVIAILVIEVLGLLKKSKWSNTLKIKATTVALLLMMSIGAFGTYHVTHRAIENQTYIQIEKSRAIPAVHFMSMGVSGEGGYNAKDALKMAALPTKAEKTKYSIDTLVARLRKKGIFGYLKFLFEKQANNSADGTFGWLKEGHFFTSTTNPKNVGIAGHLKQFVFLYGHNIEDFRFIAQIWWVILLALILLGRGQGKKIIQVLRLATIGGFLFLLLFEGGRSRYLIQFLPLFLISASLLAQSSMVRFRQLFSWGKQEAEQPIETKQQGVL
jgi:integral membrane protein (TIGR03766 family)